MRPEKLEHLIPQTESVPASKLYEIQNSATHTIFAPHGSGDFEIQKQHQGRRNPLVGHGSCEQHCSCISQFRPHWCTPKASFLSRIQTTDQEHLVHAELDLSRYSKIKPSPNKHQEELSRCAKSARCHSKLFLDLLPLLCHVDQVLVGLGQKRIQFCAHLVSARKLLPSPRVRSSHIIPWQFTCSLEFEMAAQTYSDVRQRTHDLVIK